jgi:DUF1009 family protein
MEREKLGIFAGQGHLPDMLAETCRREGRPFCFIAIEGQTPPALVEADEHFWTHFGAVGATIEALRDRGVELLTMAGRMQRPKMGSLKPDAKGTKLMARLGLSLFSGDDKLLRTITQFFEEEGFRIIGADALLADALTPTGVLGQISPSAADREDIQLGVREARALGARDEGQAVIVQARQVLGYEDITGTDALIARCAPLKREGAGGVLVKVMKPGQERRADLPAMGVETVRRMHEAGFAGIAMEAGHSLLLGRDEAVAEADAAGIFLYGVEAQP